MHLIGLSLLLIAIILIFKAVFRSKFVDDFANDICNLEVKKTPKELYKSGKQAIEELEHQLEVNESKQENMREENDAIKNFSKTLAKSAKVEEEEAKSSPDSK